MTTLRNGHKQDLNVHNALPLGDPFQRHLGRKRESEDKSKGRTHVTKALVFLKAVLTKGVEREKAVVTTRRERERAR